MLFVDPYQCPFEWQLTAVVSDDYCKLVSNNGINCFQAHFVKATPLCWFAEVLALALSLISLFWDTSVPVIPNIIYAVGVS